MRAFKALLGRNDDAKLLDLQDPEIISLDYERFNGEKAAAEAAAMYRASSELEEKAAELARTRLAEQIAAANSKTGKGSKNARGTKNVVTPGKRGNQ